MERQFQFKTEEIESQLKNCAANGITEFSVHDDRFASDRTRVLNFARAVLRDAPNLFVSVRLDPKIIDVEVCSAFSRINSSIEMDFVPSERGFDKKLYSKKCAILNSLGLVFGVNLYFACGGTDSFKLFRDRLDFTVSQYPNHIDFPQLESDEKSFSPQVSGTFSAKDIAAARNISFACRTFYSSGRAVTWFNSVVSALRIQPSAFFADFSEWQKVNNCDFRSGFVPEDEKHSEIERMQVLFLEMKVEEKQMGQIMPVVRDVVKLNGAFSRLVAEGEDAVLELDYSPDDLFGPESVDIVAFSNDVCMERCRVSVFVNSDGEPDYSLK